MWRRWSFLVKQVLYTLSVRGRGDHFDQVLILTLPVTVFREYFVADNMHKKEGQDLSQSLSLLKGAGYSEAIVAALKSHATVSSPFKSKLANHA